MRSNKTISFCAPRAKRLVVSYCAVTAYTIAVQPKIYLAEGSMHRRELFFLVTAIALIAIPMNVRAQQQPAATTDAAYIAKASTAAPAAVAKDATFIQLKPDGTMRTLRTGTNQFTCAVLPGGTGTPMCADKGAMSWMGAYMMKTTPPDVVGFMYMLAGDQGTSNTDPFATAPTPANHWVKTGPHVMIVGPAAKMMGYPTNPDPDTAKPFVMWSGTPYAHLMIPVTTTP